MPLTHTPPTAAFALAGWPRRLFTLLAGMVLIALGGCNASGPPTFNVQIGQYQQAFNAARDVLRDYHFQLERVDGAQGVITTADLFSAGLLTPWDQVQTTPQQELSDIVNNQARRVRIVFARASQQADPIDPPSDAEACVGDVQVVIRRVQVALVRPNSRSVSLTTTAVDPALTAKQIWGNYAVPFARDEELERRIARAIEARLSKTTKAAAMTPPPGPRNPPRGPRTLAQTATR